MRWWERDLAQAIIIAIFVISLFAFIVVVNR